ncbi:MAG: DUF1559 domain-containing protein [Cytophagales bacterium]|nr:DUF1559 domain-containing protein [Armatimonadota bacterium]
MPPGRPRRLPRPARISRLAKSLGSRLLRYSWVIVRRGRRQEKSVSLPNGVLPVPFFAQAREKARQTACMANLKQIGLAT